MNKLEPFIPPTRRVFKVERNRPCYCGSNKKYKKCHYLKDTAIKIQKQKTELKPKNKGHKTKYRVVSSHLINRAMRRKIARENGWK